MAIQFALWIFHKAPDNIQRATTNPFYYPHALYLFMYLFFYINGVSAICAGIGRSVIHWVATPCVLAVCVVGDLAWLVRGLIAAASDSESAVLSWPLPPVSLMAARPRAKVTGALAPVQMALLTAITHSANQTARDGTPALPLPEPSPCCWCCSAYVRPGREGESLIWSAVRFTHLQVAVIKQIVLICGS